ncbi:MAG TPA: hypothetical protein VFA21_08105 [Pyrinomonadaceae bacterium]|jgi:hypothetical protein|nr:hypothetical protein [Pyrinomonadaceae bacterium]
MEETTKQNVPSGESSSGENTATPERDAEATSSETLSDIEASEKVSDADVGDSESSPLETSSPNPDGGDSGGPM